MKYTKGSFITVPNKQVLKGKDSLLQCVYMWVCSFADEEGICYPSYQTIADHAGCSKSTVTKKIKLLVELGLLEKTNRFKNNEQKSNLYQLILQGIPSDTTPIPSDTMGGIPSDGHRTKSTYLTKSTQLKREQSKVEETKLSIEQFVEKWNLVKKIKISEVKSVKGFIKCTKINSDIRRKRRQVVDKYSKEEIAYGVRQYALDIKNRNQDNDYAKHRFSLYEFIAQGNGLKRFINS